MLKGFEDAFVDAQSRVILLCMELLQNAGRVADKIYVYIFQNDVQDFVHVFLRKMVDYTT